MSRTDAVLATHARANLNDRTAVVTGASSGIGAAVARELAHRGAKVLLVGRDEGRLNDVRDSIPAEAGQVAAVAADLVANGAAERIVAAATKHFGRVDTLVHAAGIFEPGMLDDLTHESLQRQWQTNVAAPLLLTQAALPGLRDGGRIVFFTSIFGRSGYAGSAAYAATKGALDSVTLALAAELAPLGVRVNAVAPGCVETGMNIDLRADRGVYDALAEGALLRRWATPEEIAPAVAFLVADEASFVHGSTLVVDGGWLAR